MVCANVLTSKNHEANPKKIKECRKLIKQNAGMFSNFRGLSLMVLSTMLSMEENPGENLDKAIEKYDVLKKELSRSEYLTTVSLVLTRIPGIDIDEIAKDAKKLYKLVKKDRPFITGAHDYVYVILFALKNSQVEDSSIKDFNNHSRNLIEDTYVYLRKNYMASSGLRGLSKIIALEAGEAYKEVADKAIQIRDGLNDNKLKIRNGIQQSILGVLACLDVDAKQLVDEITEVHNLLRKQKGFGGFYVDTPTRLMFAASLVSHKYLDESGDTTQHSLINSVISIIIAQQIAMMIMMTTIAASSAAASAG